MVGGGRRLCRTRRQHLAEQHQRCRIREQEAPTAHVLRVDRAPDRRLYSMGDWLWERLYVFSQVICQKTNVETPMQIQQSGDLKYLTSSRGSSTNHIMNLMPRSRALVTA